MQTRRWLSQAEVAEYLGVTTRTVRRYIALGLLPACRIKGSRLIRIHRADANALLRPIPTARHRGGQSDQRAADWAERRAPPDHPRRR